MEKTDLLSRISTLNPSDRYIPEALAFLGTVIKNNPNKRFSDLISRPDVAQAQKVLLDWIDDVKSIRDDVFNSIPKLAGRAFVSSVNATLDKMENDLTLTEVKVAQWRNDDNFQRWGASVILRMTWLQDWIQGQVEGLLIDTPYKRWVCRMALESCSFCKALNGVTIPRASSFAKYARAAGWKRVYGGLYAPKLHPRCQCRIEAATKEEYDTYKGKA